MAAAMGLRGKRLGDKRREVGVGQWHIAKLTGQAQSVISYIESEKFSMPRGFSARYQAALADIVEGRSPHFDRCGCKARLINAQTALEGTAA